MQSKFTREADFRQERDFSAKFSATFEFLGAHWRPLGKCLLYFVVPAALLMGLLMGIAQNSMLRFAGRADLPPAERFNTLNNLTPTYWLGMLTMLICYALLGATVYGYVRVRMELPAEQEVTPRLVWEQVLRLAPRLAVSTVVVLVITMLGCALLLVPGIYLSVALSLVWAVQSFESPALGGGISRSISLIRGKWWSTLGLSFVMTLLIAVVGMLFQIPQYLTMLGKMMHWQWLASDALTVASTMVGSIGQMVLYTPLLLALLFQYFNLVERKEGVGLRSLVDSLGSSPAPVAYNHAFRPDDEGEY